MPRTKKASAPSGQRQLKITLVKSPIGFNRNQARVVDGHGAAADQALSQLADTPETRGMILKVRHLIEVA